MPTAIATQIPKQAPNADPCTLAHDEELLTAAAVAKRLATAEATLADWRVKGNGPEFIKLGKRVLYPVSRLDAWLAERLRRSTSDTGIAA